MTLNMARTRTEESRDPSDSLVRVRGGRSGVRFIALSDWKTEIKERKKIRTERNKIVKEIRLRTERKQRKKQK